MEFHEILRLRRLQLRWTQQELADASGVHVRQVARYELGEQEPRLSTAAALADALGLTLDQLTGLTPGWDTAKEPE